MKKSLWTASLVALALMITGCEKTLETPKEPVVDASLARVDALRTLPGSTEVGFEWTPLYDDQVEGYYLYRVEGNSLKKIATIKDKYVSHYVDTKLAPNTTYAYRISTYSPDKHESELSAIAVVTTTAAVAKTPTIGGIEPVSYVKAIGALPSRVKLIWRPHASENVESYIIERNEFKSTNWEEVGKVKGRLNAEYMDKGLRDNYVYRYRVRVKTFDDVVSRPSEVVEAQTKALPDMITGLRATSDLPKKVILTWNPSTTSDFTHYKIYRSPTTSLLYSYYGKTTNTEFEDYVNENGKIYYYKVVAVDKDGLESKQQESPIAGMTMPSLAAPVANAVKYDGRSVRLSWVGDRNTVKYTIIKEYKLNGETRKQNFTGIFEPNYQDMEVSSGVEYVYHIIAIDKYGIASNLSDAVVVTIPKD